MRSLGISADRGAFAVLQVEPHVTQGKGCVLAAATFSPTEVSVVALKHFPLAPKESETPTLSGPLSVYTGSLADRRAPAVPTCSPESTDITIFSEPQGLPLLPLHQDTDSAYAHINEKHAYSGVQKEVDEVPKREATPAWSGRKPPSWGLSEVLPGDGIRLTDSLCVPLLGRVAHVQVFMQEAMEMAASTSRCLKRC